MLLVYILLFMLFNYAMSNAKITFLFLKLILSVFNNASLLLLLLFSAETTVVYRQRFLICVQTSFWIFIPLFFWILYEFSSTGLSLIVRCSTIFSRIYLTYCILITFFPLRFGVTGYSFWHFHFIFFKTDIFSMLNFYFHLFLFHTMKSL